MKSSTAARQPLRSPVAQSGAQAQALGKTPYRGNRYWEQEQPVEARTARVWLSYFPKAGKLQLSRTWLDRETGEARRGRTVTLDSEDLALHDEARALLGRFLEEAAP